jgi:hypothetical protein
MALRDIDIMLTLENAHVIRLRELLLDQRAEQIETAQRAEHLIEELTSIRIALGRVAVYEGMVDYSPTVLLVDELVRDHEELEARIDAVLSYLSTQHQTRPEIVDEVARLLKGGTRVPDTIEEI